MPLLKFLLCLLAFIGVLAAAGALVISVLLMLRFPPLLVAVLLACWILNRLIKILKAQTASRAQSPTRQE